MRKHHYLWLAILFVGVCSSCSQENSVNNESTESANVVISLQGATSTLSKVASRSHGALPTGTGDVSDASEGNINRIVVGVFIASTGAKDVITESSTLGSGNTFSLAATAGDREIIVVANAPEGYFSGVSSKSEFIGKAVSLEVTKDPTSGQLASNLPMSGQAVDGASSTIITLNAATTTSVSVVLNRLVSRISISKVQTNFDPTGAYGGCTFVPTSIFIFNAKTSSNWAVGNVLPTTTGLGQGESTVVANLASYLGDSVTDYDLTTGTFSSPYYFYVFANYSSSAPTKLVIKGIFTTVAGVASTKYYGIVINRAQVGTSLNNDGTDVSSLLDTYTGFIDRNKRYALTATIKTVGTTTPYEDIIPGGINLTVSVAAWDMDITQDVTFQ